MLRKSIFIILVLICFITSVSIAQVSDEEGLELRRQRIPEKNTVQKIINVPTEVERIVWKDVPRERCSKCGKEIA